MHGPPPPLPNLDPIGSSSEERTVTPEEAPTFFPQGHRNEPARAAGEVAKNLAELAGGLSKHKKIRDDISRELKAATTGLADKASRPVLDERDERRRSMPERRR